MQENRRKFIQRVLVGGGVFAGLGALWLASSERRLARMLRTILADTKRRVLPAPAKPQPDRWSDDRITISWLGHASVLINFYGLRILTDPVFGSRVGVDLGLAVAGPKRYVAAALGFQELPPIDVVLLSHAHHDHIDVPSLKRFPSGSYTVTARETTDILPARRLQPIVELGWNERTVYRGPRGEMEITAFEVRHWGRRWPSDMERGYNGYVLRRNGKSIIFGGDTAYTPLFKDLRTRGPHVAALMPIGAYQPWIRSHCTPEEALAMTNDAGAQYVVPIHHQTYRLSDEPMTEPVERLTAALQREPERLGLRAIGETFTVPV